MSHVISKDGTRIAYEITGTGPTLIVVYGAMFFREVGPLRSFGEHLKSHFKVYLYDRRGRGESGDTPPYDPEREVEDLDAAAGGSVYVLGVCTGAALALAAAGRVEGIEKLALYEAPFIVDDTDKPDSLLIARLTYFGMTPQGRTLAYDIQIINKHLQGKPIEPGEWADVTMPVLVIAGGRSPSWLQKAQVAIARTLPNAELRTLEDQTHSVKPAALAPVLVEFFDAELGEAAAPAHRG